ncbi:unnamed protein product [Arctia plantaginis]|uniref:Uncharacterized protein n=1 Tax=Arctia plantaginis TaxID=874455 RepID=A0A8S1A0A6_ARCPL|nr:unnamed protein product [Arctia plantaginis]
MTKKEFCLIYRNRQDKEYYIDNLFKTYGQQVFRLLPYQCELNTIEYVSNLMKQKMAEKNIDQLEKNIEALTREAIKSINAADWKKEVDHVSRLANEYWKKGLEELEEREQII